MNSDKRAVLAESVMQTKIVTVSYLPETTPQNT